MKMKILRVLTIALFSVFSFCSCEKENHENGLKIEAGFVCGFGSGTDSIRISNSKINYVYYVPGNSPKAIIDTSMVISKSQWADMTKGIELKEFWLLDYNSCGLCVDGCDERIEIQNNGNSHAIRFPMGLEIDSIGHIQAILRYVRQSLNKDRFPPCIACDED